MISELMRKILMINPRNKKLKYALVYFDPRDGFHSPKKFEYMLELKKKTNRRLFACYLRAMMQANTLECTTELMKELYKGLKKSDLMTKEELSAFRELPDDITIWRGSNNPDELEPRLSWSIEKFQTDRFAKAHRFKAIVNKNDIIAYYGADYEKEVIADVPKGKYVMEY